MARCASCAEENPERARFCLNCGTPLGAPSAPVTEVRKTVTILFADVVSSTARGERTDPESTRRMLARYFDAMRRVLERHGGTVEKFIGDAVMAVFGIPTLHEDDALRAVRAADEMRRALDGLNAELVGAGWAPIEVRIGINTGEVVAGDPAGQTLVTGDAVNVAARLEQAAGPGQVLLGVTTQRLVRDAVDAERLAPLEVRGKAEPLDAFRLVAIGPALAGSGRRTDTPLVGRDRELRLLHEAFERAVREEACHLFTLLGAAGVGKSRLVHEFLAEARRDATVLRGRCLPYGDGITFWPIAEIVQAAAVISLSDRPEEGRAKLAALLEPLGSDAAGIAEGVAAAIGLSDAAIPVEDMFWAVRRMLETIAAQRPLVVVIDDLHWAEATLLDLVEHVADWSREAPILLLAVARPELLDLRQQWAGGKLNATSILLEPLSPDESSQLIGNLVGDAALGEALHRRISEAAEGNPLFVEELVAMLVDDGLLRPVEGGWEAIGDLSRLAVPPTVSALVAARLDRLEVAERDVIGRAAVVGKTFQRAAVAELTPPERRPDLTSRLMALVRKELVRPDRSTLAGGDAFRFRHMLVRDAAYASLPKEQRAELHARFADWLEQLAGERLAEYEEVIGYHLEQACQYRVDLDLRDERTTAIAARGAGHLAAAGDRALQRNDMRSAAGLLKRAAELAPEAATRLRLLLDGAYAQYETGDITGARRTCVDAVELARSVNDAAGVARAELALAHIRAFTDPSFDMHDLAAVADRLEPLVNAAGDLLGRLDVAEARYNLSLELCRWADALQHAEHGLQLAEEISERRRSHRFTVMAMNALRYGPVPADEALRQIEALAGHWRDLGHRPAFIGPLLAMLGRFDQGRQLIADVRRDMDEKGLVTRIGGLALALGPIELMAGDWSAAERVYRESAEILGSIGETGVLSTIAVGLAESLHRQGRSGEAREAVSLSRRTAARNDIASQAGWRAVEAKLDADSGARDRAAALIAEAMELVEPTDFLDLRAEVMEAAAHVHRAAGRDAEARSFLARALAEHERKGNIVQSARIGRLLAEAEGTGFGTATAR